MTDITCPKCQSTDLRQVTPAADNGKAAYRCNACRKFFAAPTTTYPTQAETLRTAGEIAADGAAAANWRTLLRLLSDNGIAANTPEAIVADMLLSTLPGPASEPAPAVEVEHTTTPRTARPFATITYADTTARLAITNRGELTITRAGRTYIFPLENLVLHLLEAVDHRIDAPAGRIM